LRRALRCTQDMVFRLTAAVSIAVLATT
jgi:hypothetical protein